MAEVNTRDLAILRAVAGGHAELNCGCLRIDGRWCCDQAATYRLARAGLIRPACPDLPSSNSSPAVLTTAGYAELAGAP